MPRNPAVAPRKVSPLHTMELPSIKEAYEILPPEEFARIQKEYSAYPTPQSKFNYAWALLKQSTKNEQYQAQREFKQIYQENPNRRRETLYYLAMCSFKLNELDKAKDYLQTLLKIEDNLYAKQLMNQVDEQIKSDGMIGIAIVGVVVAGVAGLVGALLGGKKK